MQEKIMSGNYEPMTGMRWSGVSEQAKELVYKLVVVDLGLSAEQILQPAGLRWIKRFEMEQEGFGCDGSSMSMSRRGRKEEEGGGTGGGGKRKGPISYWQLAVLLSSK